MSKLVSFGKFGACNSKPVTTDLDGWVPHAGSPSMKTWIEHATEDGKFLTGFWEAMPGTYRVDFYAGADEFAHMFEGELTLTEDGGKATHYVGGDAFYVPKGWKGTWKIEKRIRKVFAIRVLA